jgi:hypothetical protein
MDGGRVKKNEGYGRIRELKERYGRRRLWKEKR